MPASDSTTRGHLFIINSDLTTLKCDAVLVPTDTTLSITRGFRPLVATSPAKRVIKKLKKSGWGGRTLVKVEPRGTGPRIWLGDIGGTEETPIDVFTSAAETFVKDAVDDLRATAPFGLPPVVALPAVGTGHGGGADRRGEILQELVPLLMRLAVESECDIVLVTYGRASFDAAQSVRRTAIEKRGSSASPLRDPWSALGEDRRGLADELAGLAGKGELVVFVGAGVSAGAGLPAWRGLLDRVASNLGFDERKRSELAELDLRDQAALLSDMGEPFAAAVKAELSTSTYSLTHGLLASLPVREFVTTNFDTLLETAAKTPGNELSVVPGSPVSASSRILVKLHGTLGRDLVLTRSEYRDVKSRHGALFGLLQAYMITKHMLFVGYSMQDEDFNEVMHDVRELRKTSLPIEPVTGSTNADDEVFGTVLTAFENSQFSALWRDLKVVAAGPSRHVGTAGATAPTQDEWDQVTRAHALFLDRIGMMSAGAGFAADETFDGMEVSGTEELRAIVKNLRKLYAEHGDEGSRWRDVRVFLESFGPASS
jgi:hypothetical protein